MGTVRVDPEPVFRALHPWHPTQIVFDAAKNAAGYGGKLASAEKYPGGDDIGLALLGAGTLILIKLAVDEMLQRSIAKHKRPIPDEKQQLLRCILDEAWMALGGLVMSMWAIITMHGIEGCNLWHSNDCYHEWPVVDNSRLMPFYIAELSWYFHMLASAILGLGSKRATVDIIAHHVITLTVILGSFTTNLLRMGALTLSVYNVSNPFLHVSKISNHLEQKVARKAWFSLFGAVFFLTRIVMLPVVVMRNSLLPVLDFPVRHVWGTYCFVNSGLIILAILQYFWMHRIIRVLQRGSAEDPKKGKQEVEVEPAPKPAAEKKAE